MAVVDLLFLRGTLGILSSQLGRIIGHGNGQIGYWMIGLKEPDLPSRVQYASWPSDPSCSSDRPEYARPLTASFLPPPHPQVYLPNEHCAPDCLKER